MQPHGDNNSMSANLKSADLESNVVFVVGDRFAGFAQQPGVMTVSALLDHLANDNGESLCGRHIVPGQGLSREAMKAVIEQARDCQLSPWFRLWNERVQQAKAERDLSHKHVPHNILISLPRKTDEDHYELEMDIDDRSEIMSDHVTGQHVQGMMIIEACRQAFLAVTEAFFIDESFGENYSFVIDETRTAYHAFLFPVGIRIEYAILEKDIANPAKLKFSVEMRVVQNGVVAAEVAFKFTALKHHAIDKCEKILAAKALRLATDAAIAEIENTATACSLLST
jgi:hypothetical protein